MPSEKFEILKERNLFEKKKKYFQTSKRKTKFKNKRLIFIHNIRTVKFCKEKEIRNGIFNEKFERKTVFNQNNT